MRPIPSDDLVSDIIRYLGSDYTILHKQKRFTQKEESESSVLSIFTISTFESGHSTRLAIVTYIKSLLVIEYRETYPG